jgi:hypothetical protein
MTGHRNTVNRFRDGLVHDFGQADVESAQLPAGAGAANARSSFGNS